MYFFKSVAGFLNEALAMVFSDINAGAYSRDPSPRHTLKTARSSAMQARPLGSLAKIIDQQRAIVMVSLESGANLTDRSDLSVIMVPFFGLPAKKINCTKSRKTLAEEGRDD